MFVGTEKKILRNRNTLVNYGHHSFRNISGYLVCEILFTEKCIVINLKYDIKFKIKYLIRMLKIKKTPTKLVFLKKREEHGSKTELTLCFLP